MRHYPFARPHADVSESAQRRGCQQIDCSSSRLARVCLSGSTDGDIGGTRYHCRRCVEARRIDHPVRGAPCHVPRCALVACVLHCSRELLMSRAGRPRIPTFVCPQTYNLRAHRNADRRNAQGHRSRSARIRRRNCDSRRGQTGCRRRVLCRVRACAHNCAFAALVHRPRDCSVGVLDGEVLRCAECGPARTTRGFLPGSRSIRSGPQRPCRHLLVWAFNCRAAAEIPDGASLLRIIHVARFSAVKLLPSESGPA